MDTMSDILKGCLLEIPIDYGYYTWHAHREYSSQHYYICGIQLFD